jgi:hypothetical protein
MLYYCTLRARRIALVTAANARPGHASPAARQTLGAQSCGGDVKDANPKEEQTSSGSNEADVGPQEKSGRPVAAMDQS